jgi:hypothetical protein
LEEVSVLVLVLVLVLAKQEQEQDVIPESRDFFLLPFFSLFPFLLW